VGSNTVSGRGSRSGTAALSGRKSVKVCYRGVFAYIDGHLPDGTVLPLCRLRYGGHPNSLGFAIYLAGKNGYQDSILPRLRRPAVHRALLSRGGNAKRGFDESIMPTTSTDDPPP
jgi:hypothetical protein